LNEDVIRYQTVKKLAVKVVKETKKENKTSQPKEISQ